MKYLIAIGLVLIFQQCTDEEKPTVASVTTAAVTQILATSVVSGGEVTKVGSSDVVARGICWSALPGPTVEDEATIDGEGKGGFESLATDLTPATTYYIRAYATNAVGTAYGEEFEFTTAAVSEIATTAITSITTTQATSGGTIISDGGSSVIARGVCWSTSPIPTIANSKTTDGTGGGNYVSSLTGLTAGTTYYARAYATTAVETFYGSEISFTTALNLATFYAVKDATIFNKQDGSSPAGNYGAGGSELIQVGYAGGSTIYPRALVQFDLSALPANAVVESVRLEFTVGGTSGAATPIISIHKLNQAWTEGTTTETNNCKYNTTCNVQGTVIVGSNDVTWNEISYSGTLSNPWTTLGGHFVASASAASNDANSSSLMYVSSGLKADVLSWIATPSSNNGWLLKTEFITSTAMGRFLSREGAAASGNTGNAPRLIISYR